MSSSCVVVRIGYSDLANDLMPNADWQRALAPAAVDGVDIGAADTAALDGNVNVTVLEGLELELWRASTIALRSFQ